MFENIWRYINRFWFDLRYNFCCIKFFAFERKMHNLKEKDLPWQIASCDNHNGLGPNLEVNYSILECNDWVITLVLEQRQNVLANQMSGTQADQNFSNTLSYGTQPCSLIFKICMPHQLIEDASCHMDLEWGTATSGTAEIR